MNILFWNTGLTGKRTANATSIEMCLREIIEENGVDLLVLAEYSGEIDMLCNQLTVQFSPLFNTNKYIKAMINPKYKTETLMDQSRYFAIKITTVLYTLIVGMIHGVSKWRSSEEKQEMGMGDFIADISRCESDHNCTNTIVIGDFNVNPFEEACISARNLHAIPFREEVQKKRRGHPVGSRGIDKRSVPMFYNPTWKLMGRKAPPYTTYHYDSRGEPINYYWNAFDQAIVRPQLIKAFDENRLSIITATRNHALIKENGTPDEKNYSDHLPLFCVLREEYI